MHPKSVVLRHYDHVEPDTLHPIAKKTPTNAFVASTLLMVASLILSACTRDAGSTGATDGKACIDGGYFAGSLYGSISGDLRWQDQSLQCEGMPRPDGEGARIRFAGKLPADGTDTSVAVIIAMPLLVAGAIGDEQPARVTVMEEDAGRFFSSENRDICWADVLEQAPTVNDSGRVAPYDFAIRGLLYCAAPLAELNGDGSLTLGDIEFRGHLSWSADK